jgi:hypothetical protein
MLTANDIMLVRASFVRVAPIKEAAADLFVLLWTLARGLGDAFTPDVRAAWTKVCGVLAATMQAGAADLADMQAAE